MRRGSELGLRRGRVAMIHLDPAGPDPLSAITIEAAALSYSHGNAVAATWFGGDILRTGAARVYLPRLRRAAGDG